MTTITTPAETTTDADVDQWVVMNGIGWKGYTAVLRVKGPRRRYPKLVYLDGDLYLMSPASRHEEIADRLGWLVKTLAEELDIPLISSRSTAFRRRSRQGGAEADESFYLANAHRIRGRRDLHLRRDPPPDLVIEAVNTHDADESVEVWRRFGVPEVWVCDVKALKILALQADGFYAEVKQSVAFPFLSDTEIFEWATRSSDGNDTAWVKALRLWVREVVVPRARGGVNDAGGA